jgi:hypothetical protein
MYNGGVTVLEAAGFHRYEVSNFAKSGEESIHNQNYWNRGNIGAWVQEHTVSRIRCGLRDPPPMRGGAPGYRMDVLTDLWKRI